MRPLIVDLFGGGLDPPAFTGGAPEWVSRIILPAATPLCLIRGEKLPGLSTADTFSHYEEPIFRGFSKSTDSSHYEGRIWNPMGTSSRLDTELRRFGY